MKRKNSVEKYFKQTDYSVIEIILIVLAGVFLAVATFVRRGGPIGIPGFLVCAFLFCIFRSFKVKDDEIDNALSKIMQDNKIEPSDNAVGCYCLKDTVVKKRKDGKLVSPKYRLTDIVLGNEATLFTVYEIDLLERTVERKSYSVPIGESIVIGEETVKTSAGPSKTSYLETESKEMIPIVLNEYKTSELIEKICERHKK